MKIRNTQLAAALIALDENLLPTTDFNTPDDVIFDFDNTPEIAEAEVIWRGLWSGTEPGSDPLSMMFKLSKARQWILEQVIHGNHNAGLVLPGVTCEINELHLACWLVADGHYLLQLDKVRRIFHFPSEASLSISSFGDYGRRYLKELDCLIRKIGSRNLARQKV